MSNFYGSTGNDVLSGTSLDDKFFVTQGGEDQINGYGGNDRFYFLSKFGLFDHVDGGEGYDMLYINGDYSAGVTFSATLLTNVESIHLGNLEGKSYKLTSHDNTVAAGNSLVISGADVNTVPPLIPGHVHFDGSAETDGYFNFLGSTGNDTFIGGAMGDNFVISEGDDDLIGGGGNDTFIEYYEHLTAGDRIDGGAGSDTLALQGDGYALAFDDATIKNVEKLLLNVDIDYSLTTADGNVAAGQKLVIDAVHSNEVLFDGSAETDGKFQVISGQGDDLIFGGGSLDTIHGGAGGDELYGNGGADRLIGGAGKDRLCGSSMVGSSDLELDMMIGGSGDDTYVINDALDVVYGETSFFDFDTVLASVDHTLAAGTERLVLLDSSLLGTGNAGNNSIFGNGYDNVLDGAGGADELSGGGGADELRGGDGADTASYAGANDGVIAFLAKASVNTGDAAGDSYVSIENLKGTSFNDYVYGDNAANVINGGPGDDFIKGFRGNDSLIGGTEEDIFIFNSTLNGQTNVDTVADYDPGEDAIWLDNAVFTALTATGVLAASAFKDLGLAPIDADDRILYDPNTGKLAYDADGSGNAFSAVDFAILANQAILTVTDFVVV